ncbi:MAG: archease [Chloroflexi bacterium]|nr:archease [Chloroflexota bacterium]
MPDSPAGYREIPHAADWELEVWAPDLPTLLEQAARGMYALCGARLLHAPRRQRTLHLAAPDAESLLVGFLNELLYLGETHGLAFDCFDLALDGLRLQALLRGAPLAGVNKEVKAVTYHKLHIAAGRRGLEARIVFDV